jgi:hypothetical protein
MSQQLAKRASVTKKFGVVNADHIEDLLISISGVIYKGATGEELKALPSTNLADSDTLALQFEAEDEIDEAHLVVSIVVNDDIAKALVLTDRAVEVVVKVFDNQSAYSSMRRFPLLTSVEFGVLSAHLNIQLTDFLRRKRPQSVDICLDFLLGKKPVGAKSAWESGSKFGSFQFSLRQNRDENLLEPEWQDPEFFTPNTLYCLFQHDEWESPCTEAKLFLNKLYEDELRADPVKTQLLVQAEIMVMALYDEKFDLDHSYPDGSVGKAAHGIFRNTHHDLDALGFARLRKTLKEVPNAWGAINYVLGEKISRRLIK